MCRDNMSIDITNKYYMYIYIYIYVYPFEKSGYSAYQPANWIDSFLFVQPHQDGAPPIVINASINYN